MRNACFQRVEQSVFMQSTDVVVSCCEIRSIIERRKKNGGGWERGKNVEKVEENRGFN